MQEALHQLEEAGCASAEGLDIEICTETLRPEFPLQVYRKQRQVQDQGHAECRAPRPQGSVPSFGSGSAVKVRGLGEVAGVLRWGGE